MLVLNIKLLMVNPRKTGVCEYLEKHALNLATLDSFSGSLKLNQVVGLTHVPQVFTPLVFLGLKLSMLTAHEPY